MLVITDKPPRSIGYALWEVSNELGAEAIITEIIPQRAYSTYAFGQRNSELFK